MHPQLELLIMMQDLDLMISELGDSSTASQEKEMGFSIDYVRVELVGQHTSG